MTSKARHVPIRIPTWLRPGPDPAHAGPEPEAEPFPSATNAARPVIELLRPHLRTGQVLIVTGYQDFLSALAILIDEVPGLGEPVTGRPAPHVRLVFGVDTGSAGRIAGGEAPGEAARHAILRRRGLWVEDAGDLRAVLAIDAIEAGRLHLQVFDPALARVSMGVAGDRRLHAKIVVSPLGAAQGPANFSRAGLYANIEYVDDFPASADPKRDLAGRAAADRRAQAERIWAAGRDWNAEALEILRALLRPVTAEDAVARAILGQAGFAPWRPEGSGRQLLPHQAALVYEASAIAYEHGFALVEAPAGAGKTDIGRALARTIPETFARCGATPAGERTGALLLAPSRVLANWRRGAPPAMQARSLDAFAREGEAPGLDGLTAETPVGRFAALLIDESHAVTSGGEAPSARAEAVGLAPPVWTVGLSATLLGNRDLDWLAHLQERRASLWMSPRWLEAMEALFERDRGRRRETGEASDGAPLTEAARTEIAGLLAPFIALRTRACIGERGGDGPTALRFPAFQVHARPPALERNAARRVADAIADRLETLAGGERRAQRATSRLGVQVVTPMGERSLLARTLLNLLRASSTLAAWEMREGKLGKRLRLLERGIPRPPVPGQLELFADLPDAPTPICDAIAGLIGHPAMADVDIARRDALLAIQARHDRVVVLSERVGALRAMAQAASLAAGPGGHAAFVCASGAEDDDFARHLLGGAAPAWRPVHGGARLERLFRHGGEGGGDAPARATAYLTYAMAEGINLQSADALVLLGVTSNVTHLVQGMGRVDRIDSPHPCVHYHPLDLPTRALASDDKVRSRLLRRDRLAATHAGSDPEAAVLAQVEASLRAPRAPREGNVHDTLGALRATLDPARLHEIEAAAPEGPWGAHLALLAPGPAMLLHLRGESGGGRFAPPRLLAVMKDGRVEREQAACTTLLAEAWARTRAAGLHDRSPDNRALGGALERLMPSLAGLRPWDLRPERCVSLLAAAVRLLGDDAPARLEALSLTDLEAACETLTRHLAPFWQAEKARIQASFLDGGAAYLNPGDVLERLEADAGARQAAVRALRDLLDAAQDRGSDASGRVGPGVVDRIAVAFVPMP